MADTMRQVAADLVQLLDDGGDKDIGAVARLVFARVAMRQAYVTVAGETSSGKSTLINGMFGHQVLPVGASPTTAAVTHVICRHEERDQYFAVFRDATQEELDREGFVGMNSSPPKGLLRLQVRARPKREDLVGLHVFDTPGYNSIFTEHGEVLEEFLPQSDVVIFVVGYRAGFGQDNQDLLEAIVGLTSDDVEVPVILVVNRVPPNVAAGDRRICEIVSNAADTLGSRPHAVLIPSVNADRREAGAATLLDTDTLWRMVAAAVAAPERQIAVDRKLRDLIRSLIDDADDRAERQQLALFADTEQAREQLEAIEVLELQREASLAAVARTTDRLRLLVPRSIKAALDNLRTALAAEVGASNKWLGNTDCADWISGHFLLFEVRAIAQSVENQISGELTQLDQELQEIANTAVKELARNVAIESNRGRFAVNLVGTLTRRVSGVAWRGLLRGKGGVGGMAAGAGNLVKMVVSRGGRLVGKTFSREVYAQIGRTFNKQFLQRLNVVITVVVEVGTYVYTSSTWQSELVRKVSSALDKWEVEVMEDVMNKQLPSIHEANENSVRDIYDDLVGADMEWLCGREQTGQLDEISARRAAFARLRESLEVNFR